MLQSIYANYPAKRNTSKTYYTTVGTKCQIVIPKGIREQIKGIKPGSKLGIDLTDDYTIKLTVVPENWSDLHYGKYKKYLKGACLEVEEMRDEWEFGSKN